MQNQMNSLRQLGGAMTIVLVGAAAAPVIAGTECTPEWIAGGSIPGVSGQVNAIVQWDRDGAGPELPVTVVAGKFAVAGATAANNIAIWNGTSWEALGSGTSGGNPSAGSAGVQSIHALAVTAAGDLIVGGNFDTAGGVTVNNIARWNGSSWSALGTGTAHNGNVVRAIVTIDNDIIIGGSVAIVSGVTVNNIARWDHETSTWSAFLPTGGSTPGVGNGATTGVNALAVLPDGRIAAGGAFTTVGGTSGFGRLAIWNPTDSTWGTAGVGVNNTVNALAVHNGNLIVGGSFTQGGGSTTNARFASWNGSAWSNFGSGPGTVVTAITVRSNGDIVAGGARVASWNGSAWTPIWTINAAVQALSEASDGTLYAGGTIDKWTDGVVMNNITRWDGSTWSAISLADETNGPITALAYLANGDLVAAGNFTKIGGVPARFIARQHNGVWSALGDGLDSAPASISELPSGNIVVTYISTLYGGTVTVPTQVAEFNGTTWQPFGTPFYIYSPRFSRTLSNGNLLVSGYGGIAEWDGTEWLPIAPEGGVVLDVLPLANGNLVATGSFEGGLYNGDPSGALRIAQYNGFGWESMGYGLQGTGEALAQLPNGDVVVGGHFRTAIGTTPAGRRVLRWDGAAWQLMSTGLGGSSANSSYGGISHNEYVVELSLLPNNDLIAGGVFRNEPTFDKSAINNIARWDGAEWQPLGEGIEGEISALSAAPTIAAMVIAPDGSLVVGGSLTKAGGQVSAYIARWGCPPPVEPTCPADFNGDDARDVADLFAYINAWLAKTANADFNDDSTVDVADLFAYINAWLAGC